MRFAHPDPRIDHLRGIEVLAGLTTAELTSIARLTTGVRFRPGDQLCLQGRIGDQVFLVLDGRVGIGRDDVPVAVVGAGALVGEMALIESAPRSATATALSDVSALVMSPREFTQLLVDHPKVEDRIRALGGARRRELAGA